MVIVGGQALIMEVQYRIMENFMVLANTTDPNAGGSMWTILIFYAVIIVGFYLLLIRPSSKKKKKEEAMRKNAQIGDEITTIGGIVGRIISVKEETDTVVIETGTDRAKLRVKRWAIGSVDTEREEPAEKEKAEKSKK